MTAVATPPTRRTTRLAIRVARHRAAAAPVVAAVVAMLLSHLVPTVSALLVALVVGAVVANLPIGSERVASAGDAAKSMLRVGVALLGLQLPLQEIAKIGPRGALVIVATVATTYTCTRLIGRRMGLDRDLVTLVASGFSICGAAAIAAVSDVIRARQRDVALAVAMVTIFGSAMIAFIPWAGRMLDLGEVRSAVWAGASIHEVAQVAAAASLVGGGAVALAMLVKLGRVALLAPVCWATGRTVGEQGRGPAVPWFILAFAAASTIRTVVPLPHVALHLGTLAATLFLAAGMFGLGLGLRLRDLWPIPVRVLLLAACSTAIAAGISLAMILLAY